MLTFGLFMWCSLADEDKWKNDKLFCLLNSSVELYGGTAKSHRRGMRFLLFCSFLATAVEHFPSVYGVIGDKFPKTMELLTRFYEFPLMLMETTLDGLNGRIFTLMDSGFYSGFTSDEILVTFLINFVWLFTFMGYVSLVAVHEAFEENKKSAKESRNATKLKYTTLPTTKSNNNNGLKL